MKFRPPLMIGSVTLFALGTGHEGSCLVPEIQLVIIHLIFLEICLRKGVKHSD